VAGPEQMRQAVAGYVAAIHRSYLAQADTFPPAVRGAMPLLAAGQFSVAAAAARNLHLIATTEPLGPPRGQEVELAARDDGLAWTVRFFDPVVLPALGLVDETAEAPAFAEIRRLLGVVTVLYHLTASPGSTFSPHNAAHVGTGLASGHTAAGRAAQWWRSGAGCGPRPRLPRTGRPPAAAWPPAPRAGRCPPGPGSFGGSRRRSPRQPAASARDRPRVVRSG